MSQYGGHFVMFMQDLLPNHHVEVVLIRQWTPIFCGLHMTDGVEPQWIVKVNNCIEHPLVLIAGDGFGFSTKFW